MNTSSVSMASKGEVLDLGLLGAFLTHFPQKFLKAAKLAGKTVNQISQSTYLYSFLHTADRPFLI